MWRMENPTGANRHEENGKSFISLLYGNQYKLLLHHVRIQRHICILKSTYYQRWASISSIHRISTQEIITAEFSPRKLTLLKVIYLTSKYFC